MLLWVAWIALLGAAVSAVMLARRRADHWPVAVFFAWFMGVTAARAALGAGFGLLRPVGAPPFTGAARVAFHADQAMELSWSAGLAAVAIFTGDHVEAYLIGIVTAVMALLIGFAFSIATGWYVRSTVDRDLALLRADILGNLAEVRREATVRRVIKTLDEVPPELLSPVAREHIAEVMALTKRGPVPVVRAAIDMGVVQSKIGRELNQLDPNDYEEAGPAGPDDPCPEDENDELLS